MPRRLAPALLWIGYGVTALWAIALRIALSVDITLVRTHPLLRPFAFGAGLIVANIITFVLAVKIRNDCPRSSRMRTGWTLLAGSAAIGLLRYGILTASLRLRIPAGMPMPGGGGPPIQGLLLVPQVINVVCLGFLLAGLLTIWSAFRDFGLGARLRWLDWFWLAAVAASTPLLFTLQTRPYAFRTPVIIGLQRLDPLLIAACAMAGVVLARTGNDVKGGGLAKSLHYVVGFVIVRLLGLLMPHVPVPGFEWVQVPFTAASLASDWLFTLVVFHRWRMTDDARTMAKKYVD